MRLNYKRIWKPVEILVSVVIGITLFGLFNWFNNSWQLFSFKAEFVPMAPTTGIVMLLLCFSTLYSLSCNKYKQFKPILYSLFTLITIYALYIITLRVFSLGDPIIDQYISGFQYMNGVALGVMSPITAIIAITTMLSVFFSIAEFNAKIRWRTTGIILAIINLLFSLTIVLSYASGMPLFYGIRTIPMALFTALAYLFLNLALIGMYGKGGWMIDLFGNLEKDIQKKPRYFRSSSIFIFFILSTLITVGGLVFLRQSYIAEKDDVSKELQTIGDLKADQIRDWYQERLSDGYVIENSDVIEKQAVDVVLGKSDQNARNEVLQWMQHFQQRYSYAEFSLFDKTGKLILSTTEGNIDSEAQFDSTFKAAMIKNKMVIRDLHTEKRKHQQQEVPIHMNIWIPLNVHGVKAEGAWLLQVNPDVYLYPLIQSWPTFSKTGETLLVRKEGNEVVFLNSLKHKKSTALKLRIEMDKYDALPAVMAVKGKIGVVEGLDYRGEPVLSAIRSVEGTPWFLVAKVDRKEIYGPLSVRTETIWLFIFILIVLVALATGYWEKERDQQWLNRQLNLSLERQQYADQLQIISQRLELATDAAHIGIWDWDLITNNLVWDDTMYELYGISKEQFAGAYEAWLACIDPRDKDNAYQISERAIKGETEYDTEFRIKWQDGSFHYIKADGMIIRDDNGKAVRMLGTNYDITARKHAEEALKESEEDLKESQRIAKVGSWRLDIATNQVKWSDELYRMYGFDPKLPPPPYTEHQKLFTQESWERLSQALASTTETGTPYELELETVRNDGSKGWMWVFGETLRDVNGLTIALHGATQDISERKMAEEEIKRIAERLQTIIDKSPFGAHTYIVDENNDLIFTNYNLSANAILGFDHNSFIGRKIEEVFPAHATSEIPGIYRQVALTGVPYENIDYYYQDGSITGVYDVRAIQTGDRRVTAFFIDITERKQFEDKLREAKDWLQKIIDSSPFGAYTYNVSDDNKLIFSGYNLSADIIKGYEHQKLIGKTIEEAFPTIAGTDIAEINLKVMQTGEVFERIEYAYVDNKITEAYDVRTIKTGDKQVTAFFMDVTERQKAEAEIKALNESLEQKVSERTAQLTASMKELEAFSYSVSHDLRAPLRGIDGWSLALYEDYHDLLDDKGKKSLEIIRAEAQSMGKLIDAMLNLSKMSRGDMEYKPVNLSELAQSIVKKLEDIETSRIVKLTIQPDMVEKCDLRLMEIALTNLLGNAFKFTSKKSDAEVQFGKTSVNGKEAYFVKDNGVGFDMQYAGKLFGTFQRLHKTTDFAGTGIGLATVKRIIIRHGGTIWAESEPDKNTTFYFTLKEE